MSNKKNQQPGLDAIDKIIEGTFTKLKDIVDANTIIGSTINITDKLSIIPISKISVGIISGGGEFPDKKNKTSMNACSTSGFNVTPIGFITINNDLIDFIGTNIVEAGPNKIMDVLVNMAEKYLMEREEDNEE